MGFNGLMGSNGYWTPVGSSILGTHIARELRPDGRIVMVLQ